MANANRIEELKAYVKQWQSALTGLADRRQSLLDMQSKGYRFTDDAGDDYLQHWIKNVDAAVLEHQDILTRMESLLARAQAGEDV
ncbi:hypothetical protein N0A02_33785 (plasmid) [Paraburkholderia acidicola]|uniref:Uncharacterized protein n=1 Tax=Paraburkholderia acidicola TaxID=1912599 RepID=A0ABV1LYR6_9BURK